MPSQQPKKKIKRHHKTELMKKLFTSFTANTQKQLRKQEGKTRNENRSNETSKHGHTKPDRATHLPREEHKRTNT
jgi:hypothetical protein